MGPMVMQKFFIVSNTETEHTAIAEHAVGVEDVRVSCMKEEIMTATKPDTGQDILAAFLYFSSKYTGSKELDLKALAKVLGYANRHKAGDAIKRAFTSGQVRLTISEVNGINDSTTLAMLLNVVNGGNRQLLNPSVTCVTIATPEDADSEEKGLERHFVAERAADLITTLVKEISGTKETILGVSWGRTLSLAAKSICPIQNPAHTVHIVPTVGGYGGDQYDIESVAIVHEMTRRFAVSNLHGYSLPVPAYVRTDKTQKELFSIPLTRDVVAKWGKADIFVSGIGSIDKDGSALSLLDMGVVQETDLNILKTRFGAVGDLALNFLDQNGLPLSYNHIKLPSFEIKDVFDKTAHPVAITLDDLEKATKAKARHSIAIGAGVSKAKAFVAAIRGRYIDGLVTDAKTAREIMRLWK